MWRKVTFIFFKPMYFFLFIKNLKAVFCDKHRKTDFPRFFIVFLQKTTKGNRWQSDFGVEGGGGWLVGCIKPRGEQMYYFLLPQKRRLRRLQAAWDEARC